MAPKKSRDRKRQTKINFSPAPKPSPATMGNEPSRPSLTAMHPKKAPSTASKNNKKDFWGEDALAAGIKRGKELGKLLHMPYDSDDSSTGSTSPKEYEPPQLVLSRNKKALATPSDRGSEDEEEEVPVEQPKPRKRRRAATPSDAEDEEPTITVIPRKRQKRVEIKSDSSEKPKKKQKKDKKNSKRSKKKESALEEEETQPARRSTRRSAAKKSPTPDEDDEDDVPLTPAPRSRRKTTRRPSPSVEEEEEEQQSPPRSIRRRLKRRKSPSEDEEELGEVEGSANDEDDEEQEELKEELAFLRSSPPPDRGRLRSTQGKPKNKRQEALEALKRRRAGTTSEPSSATPGRKRAVVVETDSESDLEVIKEERDSDLDVLEEDDIEDDEQEESDRNANALDMFQEDEQDEQFIDDDPDNMIGEPSINDDLDEMRLAFSLSRAKTRDLFKHAVEWMVMKKIHPGFDSKKNVYTLTFRKLDDEVKGLAGSKYTSSAWTPDFTRAIRARPELMINELSAAERAVMSPHCEACNRSNHTASFELLLQGQPYHPETLEPLSTASDSSDSDSDDSDSSGLSFDSETALNGEKPSYNYQKDRIPPESHRFPLGSTCKANAQVAHTLYHWRYNLYQWVKDHLKAQGHLSAEKLVKREGKSDRKREKEARKIVDAMEAEGQIKLLWRLYKTQLHAAVEADNDYANGWGRRG
ncbi:hypothetical protein ACET3X_004525 [Alternaria dauci]|uniref:DUF4211 domain-containing protein n=1 Tax=Alternaria dauci TaxID=48095 RepID=A0ABR3UNL3_9PLEO